MNNSVRHDEHHNTRSDQDKQAPPQKIKLPLINEFQQPSIGTVTPQKLLPSRGKLRGFFSGWLAWAGQRMTLLLMLSLLSIAFLAAISHYVFFYRLNGTMTEQHRRLHQSYVTTISLLLSAVFRAAIIGSVSFAFAQHLWWQLRRKALTISRIEQLFNLRSNPFELTRLRGVLASPTLFVMAVFVWTVPLAVIYPPSALTVSTRPYTTYEELEVPILTPSYSKIGQPSWFSYAVTAGEIGEGGKQNKSISYSTPNSTLRNLADLIIMSGKIPDFPSPGGENSSYTLTFRGPQVSCDEKITDVTDTGVISNGSVYPFDVVWNITEQETAFSVRRLLDLRVPMHVLQPFDDPFHGIGANYGGNVSMLTCELISVAYNLSVSYIKGVRQITHTEQDPRPFQPLLSVDYNDTSVKNLSLSDGMIQQEHDWDKFAFADAALGGLAMHCDPAGSHQDIFNITLSNGTSVEILQSSEFLCFSNTTSLVPKSIFNPQLTNYSSLEDYSNYFAAFINLTQESINEYMTNLTIGALSLNLARNTTQVQITDNRNVYDFSAPINLILPYALCLALGTVFVALGIWCLVQNGTPAADGGFLQVMTTAIGRTRMEELATDLQTSSDTRKIEEELLSLKVRYGELVDGEGVGTGIAGFGTKEETKLLRRGWAAG